MQNWRKVKFRLFLLIWKMPYRKRRKKFEAIDKLITNILSFGLFIQNNTCCLDDTTSPIKNKGQQKRTTKFTLFFFKKDISSLFSWNTTNRNDNMINEKKQTKIAYKQSGHNQTISPTEHSLLIEIIRNFNNVKNR